MMETVGEESNPEKSNNSTTQNNISNSSTTNEEFSNNNTNGSPKFHYEVVTLDLKTTDLVKSPTENNSATGADSESDTTNRRPSLEVQTSSKPKSPRSRSFKPFHNQFVKSPKSPRSESHKSSGPGKTSSIKSSRKDVVTPIKAIPKHRHNTKSPNQSPATSPRFSQSDSPGSPQKAISPRVSLNEVISESSSNHPYPTKKMPSLRVSNFERILDEKGMPYNRKQEIQFFLPNNKYLAYPWCAGEVLQEALRKVIQLCPSVAIYITDTVTDLDGNTIDTSKTFEELGIHHICFGTTWAEWKASFELQKFTDSAETVQGSSPRVMVFRVYLPEGQFRNVFFDPNKDKTLQQVLDEVCLKMNIPQEGKIPCDLSGNVLDLTKTLSELGISVMTFGTSAPEEYPNVLSPTNNSPYVENSQLFFTPRAATISPRTPSSGLPVFHKRERRESITFTVVLPTKETVKLIWQGNASLKEVLNKTIKNRNYKWDEIEVRDRENNKLDTYMTLEELSITYCTVHFKEPDKDTFIVHLPNGNKKEVKYIPEKKLDQLMRGFYEGVPELQATTHIAYDIHGEEISMFSSLSEIPDKHVYYGILPKEWKELHHKKIKRQHVRKNKLLSPELPLDKFNFPQTPKFLSTKLLKFYLPNVQTHQLVYQPDKELEWALEKVCSGRSDFSDLRNSIPYDLYGNKLDRKKKIGELGTSEIVLGTEMQEWTLAKAQEYIFDYLMYISFKEKQPFVDQYNKQDTIFRIYLPGGTFSCVSYEAKKHMTLKEIFDSKSLWSKHGIEPSTPAITFKGTILDMNRALDDTGVRDICLGIDILDWAIAHHTHPVPDRNLPSVIRRLRFLDELGKFQSLAFETARGVTSREKHKNNNGPKSPHRKSKGKIKNINMVTAAPHKTTDYNKIIEKLEENSPDIVDGEYLNINTSIWHMQNMKKNYYEHYLHWLEEEINYKTSFMVPYKFLKQPKYKKHIFKSINIEKKPETENTINEDNDELSEESYMVWQESMDNKVTIKLREHEEVTVSYIGAVPLK